MTDSINTPGPRTPPCQDRSLAGTRHLNPQLHADGVPRRVRDHLSRPEVLWARPRLGPTFATPAQPDPSRWVQRALAGEHGQVAQDHVSLIVDAVRDELGPDVDPYAIFSLFDSDVVESARRF